MKAPRIKNNDPNNTLFTGSDLYDYAFDLHYAPSFATDFKIDVKSNSTGSKS